MTAITTRVDAMQSDPWWESGALAWLRTRAATGLPFQAHDMIRDGVPEPPHPNYVGSALAKARALGWIVKTGRRVRSTSPAANGRKVDEWVGVAQ